MNETEIYNDPLYRESIPHRITPAPPSYDGPTARWLRYLEEQAAKVLPLPVDGVGTAVDEKEEGAA